MRLGIVAREFPPAAGGMESHAAELAQTLAGHCDPIVFTSVEHADHRYDLSFPVLPVLNREIRADAAAIGRTEVDALLTLNAGYAPLSLMLPQPLFAYCHGNDYLSPWILSLSRPEAAVVHVLARTPGLRRTCPAVQRTFFRRHVAQGLQQSRHVFVNSSYTRDRLKHEYPDLDRPVTVAHPGLPDRFFDRRPGARRRAYPDAPLQLLTVARLSTFARKKNVDGILRALALLGDAVAVHLRIIGDGDLRPEFERLSADLGLAGRVDFLGEQPNPAVIEWLDRSDLLVLPSKAGRWDVESFGIVYVEAAARGVPCLMSRAGGATDAVEDGVTGIIVEAADAPSIADGILRFAGRPDAFQTERITAFAERFRWANIGRDIWATIRHGMTAAPAPRTRPLPTRPSRPRPTGETP